MGWRDRVADWVRPIKHSRMTLEDAIKEPATAEIPLIGPTPSQPVPQPDEAKSANRKAQPQTPDTALIGATGTAIISGFLEDMQEYNPQMVGRYAIPTFEEMRRSDADVASTLTACKLPILIADKVLQPGVPDNHPDYKFAQELAEFVEDNLFGGLEYENATGDKFSQSLDQVLENALLCLDFGCSASEDMWSIDQDAVRLTRMAPRLPLTFYQFPVDEDGETLRYLVQWGYRGSQWVTAAIPAGKVSLVSFRKEGANFFGRALLREMYQHWFIKTALYRIDSIACERGAAGVPTITAGKAGVDPTDRQNALAWLENFSVNENNGLFLPPEYVMELKGIVGGVRPIMPSIQHHSEMICRAPLAMFLALGTTATGSRALGNTMVDFFQLMEEWIARTVCNTISDTTIRRLVDYNYPTAKGKKLPYPRLDVPNIAVINPLELSSAIKDLSNSNVDIVQPDDKLENWFRKKIGAPSKDVARVKFAPAVQRIQDMTSTDDPWTTEAEPESVQNDQEPPKQKAPKTAKLPTAKQPAQAGHKGPQSTNISAVELSRKLDGRMKWKGLDISIENEPGSVRYWKDRNGNKGQTLMKVPYGYIRVRR